MPLVQRKIQSYGWVPDLPDKRDKKFSVERTVILPAKVDLRGAFMPPIVDQGQLGSCTANSIAGALGFDQLKQGEQLVELSRLFIYFNERDMEGTVSSDSGAMIRDGIKSVNQVGACPETEWPYDISKFTIKPSVDCYNNAVAHKAVVYKSVSRYNTSIKGIQGALAAGFPVVFGFTVYESFESQAVAANGIVPMPKRGESVMGGHAVVAVGYDNAKQQVICRNSWGTNWGDQGYFYLPYSYFMKNGLSSDFWTVSAVA